MWNIESISQNIEYLLPTFDIEEVPIYICNSGIVSVQAPFPVQLTLQYSSYICRGGPKYTYISRDILCIAGMSTMHYAHIYSKECPNVGTVYSLKNFPNFWTFFLKNSCQIFLIFVLFSWKLWVFQEKVNIFLELCAPFPARVRKLNGANRLLIRPKIGPLGIFIIYCIV